MQEIHTNSWREAVQAYEQLRNNWTLEAKKAAAEQRGLSPLLYRGHADSRWGLRTTLERYTSSQSSAVSVYYQIVRSASGKIESLQLEDIPPKTGDFLFDQNNQSLTSLSQIAYLAFLRHHGFPSPLLDWTYSFFIATFFAFHQKKEDAASASVYVYQKSWRPGQYFFPEKPCIYQISHNPITHRRHYLQQSTYTVSGYKSGGQWFFVNHEASIKKRESEQDLVWKIIIPIKERQEILEYLKDFNLTAYSLFGSPESLCETIAFEQFSKNEIFYRGKNNSGHGEKGAE